MDTGVKRMSIGTGMKDVQPGVPRSRVLMAFLGIYSYQLCKRDEIPNTKR